MIRPMNAQNTVEFTLAFNRGATDVTWSMKGQADERAQNTVKFTSARVGTLNGRGSHLSVTPKALP